MPSEVELDRVFWNAISSQPDFCSWFLARTKFSQRNLLLLTDERWQYRWYRDPVTMKDSETDILLIFENRETGSRYAVHVGNKPKHGAWEPLQAENYRKRARDRMEKWRYADFQVALTAPASFLARSTAEVAHFDLTISYEDLSAFVPAFGCV